MATRRPTTSFFTRIVLAIILTCVIAILPVAVFIYIYGDELTRDNLYDQLSVSMDDIRIRFTETLDGYSEALEDYAALPEVVSGDSLALAKSCQLIFGPLLRTCQIAVVDEEGTVLYASRDYMYDMGFEDRPRGGGQDAVSYSTSYRYLSYNGDQVVINLERDAGERHIFLDVIGSQFIRYADPALVNEVCLLDEEEGMVSSLIHLDDYRPLSSGWVFSYTLNQRGGDVLIASRELPEYGMSLVGYLDISPYMTSLNRFYALLVIVLAAAFLISAALAVVLARSLVRPIHELVAAMDEVRGDDLAPRSLHSHIREMDQLDGRFNQMLTRIGMLVRQSGEERERVRDAERKALEAQMNPHFLFNTLNVIRSMARMAGEKDIEDITTRLGRLMRYAVDNRQSTERLETSWLMVDSYLGIQKVRFADRLETSCSFDPSLKDIVTPKLIIQPLVENAIIHGLEPKAGSWHLTIEVRREGQEAVILVEDDGVGFDDSILGDIQALEAAGHTGLYNVYKRLELYYGKNVSFQIESVRGAGTKVRLCIPLEKGGEE